MSRQISLANYSRHNRIRVSTLTTEAKSASTAPSAKPGRRVSFDLT